MHSMDVEQNKVCFGLKIIFLKTIKMKSAWNQMLKVNKNVPYKEDI